MSQLVTGDAVLLDLRPARIPTRLLATGVDLLLTIGATILWGYIVRTIGGSEARVRAVTIAGGIIINFGYPVTMETLTRGRTVGAFALGLRAVRDDGGAIRFRQALLRGLAFWTVDFAIWTGFCGGLICAAVNAQSKRFGDLMAGTMVIRTRAPRPPAPLPPVPAELVAWASQLELSGLPDELVTASRHLVQRADGLIAYPRDQVARELARQVAARTAPPPPVDLPPLVYLAAVVAERRQRESARIVHQQRVPSAEELPAGWR
ncbi:MAG TPA: RDD family protein [Propionibacteriaceae bacterium]